MTFINLQNVSLQYHTKNLYNLSLKQKIISPFLKKARLQKSQTTLINSINNLTLSLENEANLGIIGRNGAGKSSLLKLISKIYPPTRGTVSVNGRVNSIMNTSLGLKDDLSAYENIIYKGVLLGLTIKDIKGKVKKIAEFAEIEDRLHNELSSYSTGMKMRLALGILLSIESDILLIDEVFGTLDTRFMNKYHQALLQNINQTSITIFVSHSFEIISTFCTDVLWLEKGAIKEIGGKDHVIKNYLQTES